MNKVSIIIPVYNKEKFLEKALLSCVNQTYKNLEIILVDDGSKDNSLNICKTFEKKYKNIKLIAQENRGVSVARNVGIENATGDWIAVVDADDEIDPERTAIMLDFAKSNKLDCVMDLIKIKKIDEKLNNFTMYNSIVTNNDYLDLDFFSKNLKISILQFMVNKSFLYDKGIKYKEGIRVTEDQLFLTDILSYGGKVRIINKAMYTYCLNINTDQHSILNFTPDYKKAIDHVKWLINKFPEHKKAYKIMIYGYKQRIKTKYLYYLYMKKKYAKFLIYGCLHFKTIFSLVKNRIIRKINKIQ